MTISMFTKTGNEESYIAWWIQQNNKRVDEKISIGFTEVSVSKDVFSPDPKMTHSVEMFMHHTTELTGKNVLDIGAGTGILSIHAIYKGANRVLCTEIDDRAILNAKQNITSHKMEERITILNKEHIDKSLGKFDIIFANIIFSKPKIKLEDSEELSKNTLSIHHNLLEELDNILTNDGRCYLGFASFGDTIELEKLLSKYPVNISIKTEEKFGVNWYYIELKKIL